MEFSISATLYDETRREGLDMTRYCRMFGLSEIGRPFFLSLSHLPTLAHLQYGVQRIRLSHRALNPCSERLFDSPILILPKLATSTFEFPLLLKTTQMTKLEQPILLAISSVAHFGADGHWSFAKGTEMRFERSEKRGDKEI